jgi:hypothetical protein
LYDGQIKPFCLHNSYDRNSLRVMFSRDDLNNNNPGRILFALFDFDDAYDDWNGLWKKESDEVVANAFNGLTKKRKTIEHYAMLLPVPKSDTLKNHALNKHNKPWGKGAESHIPIELLFYKDELLNTYFVKKEKSGGGEIIEFTYDKVKFAEDYIPTLSKPDFEIFRPMFEFIKSKCVDKNLHDTSLKTSSSV